MQWGARSVDADLIHSARFLGARLGFLVIPSLGTLNAADMMVALLALGVIGIAMALGIRPVEMRRLRWRPEYRRRA